MVGYLKIGLAVAALVMGIAVGGAFASGYVLSSNIVPWDTGWVQINDAGTGALVTKINLTDDFPAGLALGPDGNLYVTTSNKSEVRRYQGPTGANPWALIDTFVTQAGNGGLRGAEGCIFGPDGNLYVVAEQSYVMRYNGTTGAFIDKFVAQYDGGLYFSRDLAFGPDGNAYMGSWNGNNVKRYNGTTGAYIDDFVTADSGGLTQPFGVKFHGDYLYVSSRMTNSVKRYNAITGAYVDDFIATDLGGLDRPNDFDFGLDGTVYVTSQNNAKVKAYTAAGAYIGDLGGGYQIPYHALYIVPEPGSLLALGGGLLGMLGYAIRRRR